MSQVFWIKGSPPAPLAILLRPRGEDLLAGELLLIKQAGIQTLVSLLENWEADFLGLGDEGSLAGRIGLQFLSYPIPDAHIPSDMASFRAFAADLAGRLRAGEHIGVHCRGSIGRSTVAAACALIHLGWEPETALVAVEEARGCPVPDTGEQADWILRYKPLP